LPKEQLMTEIIRTEGLSLSWKESNNNDVKRKAMPCCKPSSASYCVRDSMHLTYVPCHGNNTQGLKSITWFGLRPLFSMNALQMLCC
jgi:hypothetical protein